MSDIGTMLDELIEEKTESSIEGGARNKGSSKNLFTPPKKKSKPLKIRVIAEIEANLVQDFRDVCRETDCTQRDALTHLMKLFVENHKS